jgi:hypothetical protein
MGEFPMGAVRFRTIYRYGYLVIRAVENTVDAPATTLEIQLSPNS